VIKLATRIPHKGKEERSSQYSRKAECEHPEDELIYLVMPRIDVHEVRICNANLER
jgi:hypothetical protein